MSELNWTYEAADQLRHHWTQQLRPRLTGLTDREYFWEPVADAWSVRPRGQSTAPVQAGAGDFTIDFAFPEPEPAPVTTIAWRLGHLIVGIFGVRIANHLNGPPVDYQTFVYAEGADEALSQLDQMYQDWNRGVDALTPDQLAAPCGTSEGPTRSGH